MPSTTLMAAVSGGVALCSGDIFSGSAWPFAGIQLKLSVSGAGPVFVCLPNLSGSVPTLSSGGSLSSGGMADGMEMAPGDTYFIPKARLRITTSGVSNGSGQWQTGVQDIRIVLAAASSGSRLFWEPV